MSFRQQKPVVAGIRPPGLHQSLLQARQRPILAARVPAGAVEQDRRWDEDSKKASSSSPSRASAKAAPSVAQPSTTEGSTDNGQVDAQEAEGQEPSRNFQMLVDFLTRNAAAMLGGMADPRTGQAFLDLEGAREMIDMLDVLREKTKGNLAKADEDLLLEVIGSLKLRFMEISKAAAEQMQKKAGVKK